MKLSVQPPAPGAPGSSLAFSILLGIACVAIVVITVSALV